MAKWWEAPEVAQKAVIAKAKAWSNFLNRFPKADKSQFVSEPHFDDKLNATAEVFFKESEGSLKSVFGSDRQYWSAEMKQALGLGDSGDFPYQLSALGLKGSLPIPAEPFDGKAPSLKKIYSTPKSKSTSRLTNNPRQNSEKYFKKPNSDILLAPNQNTG